MNKLDKIAAVEKAIAEKYGEETVQNPRSQWNEDKEEEYLKQLKEQVEKNRTRKKKSTKVETNGFLVSQKLFTKDTTERVCRKCKIFSFKVQDDIYMSKYGCCFKCFIQYVEGREEKWLNENHETKTSTNH